MTLVLDNSVAMEWLLRDREGERADEIILANLDALTVPALFWAEAAYVLGKHCARDEITRAVRDRGMSRLEALLIESDLASAIPGRSFDHALALGDQFGLTIYDAVYLELATRVGADLATFDKRLGDVAVGCGIRVWAGR